MKLDYYQTKPSDDYLSFRFESVSDTKTIKKMITFKPIPKGINFYNLAFGDLDEQDEMDDLMISNNADMEKVIATVIQSIFIFCQVNPTALIYIEGSTPQRTRLYRIIINKEFETFRKDFEIFGMINTLVEPFSRNRPYTAFVVKRVTKMTFNYEKRS
ncbi:DUF6934 family protein [Dyadobacter sp. CY347]|uniref:DUF6934 family protein n=1 Tax=Dyadobacter sp. CY347 TaxID=2909336 RepID=UPI001F382F03|nr:hypothetical protein [Dyadobacter sp. CY347]MCF2486613.1 hypothetical protein [Dyadobacter sp. CY347]